MRFLCITLAFCLWQSCSSLPRSSVSIRADETGRKVQHDKRQAILEAGCQAIVLYHCPLAGEQTRTFIWRARYSTADAHLDLFGIRHVESFTHVDWTANDFRSTWRHDYAVGYEEHCCLYVVAAVTVGAVYDHAIDLTLGQLATDRSAAIKITEVCVQVVPNHTCPAKTFVLHGTMTRCQILHTTVFDME